MKKIVGKVSPKERDAIKSLFERQNGLSELAKIISLENIQLYDKLVKDMGENSMNFQNWWKVMSEKYQWEKDPEGNWEIDFDTCAIFLATN
jgi:CXXX repeat modification system protein